MTADPIWEVVGSETRTQSVYVQAATERLAIEAANELWEPDEWWADDDPDCMAHKVTSVPDTHGAYWTGGPSGHWENAEDDSSDN